jgi:hypothetical protein
MDEHDLEKSGYLPKPKFSSQKIVKLDDEEFHTELGQAVGEALRVLRGISLTGSKEENQLKAASKIIDYALTLNDVLKGNDLNPKPAQNLFVFANTAEAREQIRRAAEQVTHNLGTDDD